MRDERNIKKINEIKHKRKTQSTFGCNNYSQCFHFFFFLSPNFFYS
jgi:hypothetical protein